MAQTMSQGCQNFYIPLHQKLLTNTRLYTQKTLDQSSITYSLRIINQNFFPNRKWSNSWHNNTNCDISNSYTQVYGYYYITQSYKLLNYASLKCCLWCQLYFIETMVSHLYKFFQATSIPSFLREVTFAWRPYVVMILVNCIYWCM